MSIYDIPVTTIDGKETTLRSWEGHVLLIVNVASECGFTPQYEALEHIFEEYAARGFFVIGVPSNQFGEQEPGSNEEIKEFASSKFGVTFPLLSKTDVNGDNEHPLYTELKKPADNNGETGDVNWNFEKFVLSDSGEVLGRFRSDVDPEDDVLLDLIEDNLPL